MQVIRADALGMCFGVRDALALTAQVQRPDLVTIHGELVHNREVQRQLQERGFRQRGEAERADGALETPEVLITAHGVSDRERARLESAGATLIDTTCPLVRRAHRAARALSDQGYFVVVLGKPGHVEVEGLTGDLARHAVVHETSDVRAYDATRIGIICQTTMPPPQAECLHAEVVKQNAHALEIRFVDTVCRPTKERQRALEQLVRQVNVVVVVGGHNSNNTRALVERCREAGVRAHHVENDADLDPRWFHAQDVVGLTAGTSTLDATIEAVARRLNEIDPRARLQRPRPKAAPVALQARLA